MGRHGAPRRDPWRDPAGLGEWWEKYGYGGIYSSCLQPWYLWRRGRLRIRCGWEWWSTPGDGRLRHGWALTALAAQACALEASAGGGKNPWAR